MIGGGLICWTRLQRGGAREPRTPACRTDREAWAIGESRGARMRWLAVKYTVEKLTCLRRSQVIVMVLTTMSTVLFCSALIRSADDRMRYSTCDGVPKMSRATSPAMSTSKPVISPVIGSRKREQVAADVQADDEPAAVADRRRRPRRPRPWLVNGRRLAVRSQFVVAGFGRLRRLGRQLLPCRPGSAAPASAPAAAIVYSVWPQPASSASP